MPTATDDALTYYAEHGIISDPGIFARLLDNLPQEISQLCRIIQGLLIHAFWVERYGEKPSEERMACASIRHVDYMFEQIQEINSGPIEQSRNLNERFVGNCRTFSVLLASMLRHQGKPARARCGFGRYFKTGWYEDHWICEHWSEEHHRWIMVDAQLDDFQCQELEIGFDPLDVPRDQFIVGGKAWLSCRSGETDPEKFGIFDMHGMWFIRGNLVRDIAALNKVELLPWDGWGLIDREYATLSHEDLIVLDEIASMTSRDVDFVAVRNLYESNEGLLVPPIIKSYTHSGTIEIDLSTEDIVE